MFDVSVVNRFFNVINKEHVIPILLVFFVFPKLLYLLFYFLIIYEPYEKKNLKKYVLYSIPFFLIYSTLVWVGFGVGPHNNEMIVKYNNTKISNIKVVFDQYGDTDSIKNNLQNYLNELKPEEKTEIVQVINNKKKYKLYTEVIDRKNTENSLITPKHKNFIVEE